MGRLTEFYDLLSRDKKPSAEEKRKFKYIDVDEAWSKIKAARNAKLKKQGSSINPCN